MKHFVLVLVYLLMAVSCQKSEEDNQEVLVQNLESSYEDWWLYFNNSIRLSSDFKAFDTESKKINKRLFLKSLATGKFIPLRVSSDTSETAYKLHQLGKNPDVNIISTIKNMAEVELTNFEREGKKMQPFSFKDLNGKIYTSENTLGKTVVLKCWFIHCKKCVEEMPELNKLVKQFENRNDILFVSLAFDSEPDLKTFLSKRDFDYAVVANQEDYLKNTLGISIFPTHFIINKKGVITKVANEMEIIREILGKEI